MKSKGHIHAELMAQYAEDAKAHSEPWKLWEFRGFDGVWLPVVPELYWDPRLIYRRKPKTHIVNGVEIPDLRFKPIIDQRYWYPHASMEYLVSSSIRKHGSTADKHRIENNLCYKHSYEGKQAAILHAKAMLGTEKGLQEQTAKPLTSRELKSVIWWCKDISEECRLALFERGIDTLASNWNDNKEGYKCCYMSSGEVVRSYMRYGAGLKEIYRVGNEFYWV